MFVNLDHRMLTWLTWRATDLPFNRRFIFWTSLVLGLNFRNLATSLYYQDEIAKIIVRANI